MSTWPPPVDLVDLAKTHDPQAVGALFSAGYPRLIGFYRVAGVPPADAEDLAADTVEAMVKSLPKLRASIAFEAWFWAIARTKLRSWIRRKQRGAPEARPDPEPSTPEEQFELAEEHGTIVTALDTLSPRDRELLWLREVEGLSYEEIGGRIKAAAGTVRVACHRARQRLLDAYQQVEQQP